MYIYIYTCIYIYINIHIYTYICIYIYVADPPCAFFNLAPHSRGLAVPGGGAPTQDHFTSTFFSLLYCSQA